MSATALPTPIATPDESLTPLARVLDECAAKIAADVIRFEPAPLILARVSS
jgi:hypothetical protein